MASSGNIKGRISSKKPVRLAILAIASPFGPFTETATQNAIKNAPITQSQKSVGVMNMEESFLTICTKDKLIFVQVNVACDRNKGNLLREDMKTRTTRYCVMRVPT